MLLQVGGLVTLFSDWVPFLLSLASLRPFTARKTFIAQNPGASTILSPQILITDQPWDLRAAFALRSLALFRLIFRTHHSPLFPRSSWGRSLPQPRPCQNSPSTNTASLQAGKAMSGRPGAPG